MTGIVAQFVEALQSRIASDSRYPSELFTDYKYVFGSDRCCHARTIDAIFDVAKRLPNVASVDGNRALVRDKPRWKPDAVLWDGYRQPLCIIEYESINSSDARIVEKDSAGFKRWRQNRQCSVPLLIITTLPAGPSPHYRLLYTRNDQYNWEQVGQAAVARNDPCGFWYGYYRRHLKDAAMPLHFANLNGSQLSHIAL